MECDEVDEAEEITSTLRYSDEENFEEMENPLEEEDEIIEEEEYQTEEEIDQTEEKDQRPEEKEQIEEEEKEQIEEEEEEEEKEQDDSHNGIKKRLKPMKRRNLQEMFEKRFGPLIDQDPNDFTATVRMSPELFDKLLQHIEPELTKSSGRACVPPKYRLYITLKYLAHGINIPMLAHQFNIASCTINNIIQDTCENLWKALNQWNLPPISKKKWKNISFEVDQKWKLPYCVGAAGNDQFHIRGPPAYGNFTLILLATCDVHYSITGFDIGTFAGDTYTTIAWETNYYNKLYNNELDLPDSERPPHSSTKLHYYFTVGKTMTQKTHLMKLYYERNCTKDQQHFNYRIQEACRNIENAFGVLRARWKILLGQMLMRRDSAVRLFKTIIALHNFLLKYEPTYCPPKFVDHYKDGKLIDGLWRQEGLKKIRRPIKIGSNSSSRVAMKARDALMMYLFQTYDQLAQHDEQLAEAMQEEVGVQNEIEEVEVQEEIDEHEEMKIETFFEDVEHYVLGTS